MGFMNKKSGSLIMQFLLIVSGVSAAFIVDFFANGIIMDSTVRKVQTGLRHSCSVILLNLIRDDYYRGTPSIAKLVRDDPLYAKLNNRYDLTSEVMSAWELRRDLLRNTNEIQRSGDLFLCYKTKCRTHKAWFTTWKKIVTELSFYDTVSQCSVPVYGPWKDEEVTLYLGQKA